MSIAALEQPATRSQSLTTEVSPLSVEIDADVRAGWDTLWDADRQAVSWQHSDIVQSECRHSAPSRLSPLLVQCRRDEELIGAAVLLPKLMRTKQLGAIGPNITLHGYRLAGGRLLNSAGDTGVDQRLLAAVADAVTQAAADFLLIEDLDQPSSLWNQIAETLPAKWRIYQPNGVQARLRIRFPDDGESYWQQFSSKTRGTFRRKLKKFGETRLDRITRPDQVADYLAAAHQISLQTWQSRRLGLRVRNSVAEQAVMTSLAETGLLRSYLWYAEGEPAAFCMGHQSHGVFHYEEVGYATKFARYSPGQMLVVQMLEDLLAVDRPDTFDFGGGDADYKRMFANDVAQSGAVWLTPPSWRTQSSLRWAEFCRRAKSAARNSANRLGLATRIRQWIRYGGADAAPAVKAEEEAA